MTDTPHIRRARDWPFPIPQITAEAIDELVDAIERGDRWTGSLYDELDGATREKRAHSPACPRPGPARGARCAPGTVPVPRALPALDTGMQIPSTDNSMPPIMPGIPDCPPAGRAPGLSM